MRVEDLTVAIRPRGRLESIDLGFALARANWRAVAPAWAAAALPLLAIGIAIGYWSPWVGWVVIWWFKPYYDRVVLWVLSRAVFGGDASLKALRAAVPGLLRRTQLFRDLSYRRFNLQRSFDLPVAQLEGQQGSARRERLRHLHKGTQQAAQGLTVTGCNFELALHWALFGLTFILLPPDVEIDLATLLFDAVTPWWFEMLGNLFYALVICIIEPFYVAAGFTLYLNRRTWLEGWDLELAFRQMAQHGAASAAGAAIREVA
jgi:hypothetical protein